MKSKGLKADTVKYTNIDPAARIGMLVAKKIPAIETFAMSMPGVVKAAGGQDAQIFLLANAGLSLYSNGILVREDYLKAEPAKVKAFVKASLQGWKDTIANPKEAADIVVKHIKGLDAEVVFQEIVIVNALVATPEARAKGLGTIDAKVMAESVDLIAKTPAPAARSRRRTSTTRARCRSRRSSRDGRSAVRRSRIEVDKSFAGPGRGAPDIVALEEVSYSFKQGELVALLGPSGCGKTTLLRIVAGMTRASHGRVEIRGREVLGPQDDFGFVFQAPNLLPWRTVRWPTCCFRWRSPGETMTPRKSARWSCSIWSASRHLPKAGRISSPAA